MHKALHGKVVTFKYAESMLQDMTFTKICTLRADCDFEDCTCLLLKYEEHTRLEVISILRAMDLLQFNDQPLMQQQNDAAA